MICQHVVQAFFARVFQRSRSPAQRRIHHPDVAQMMQMPVSETEAAMTRFDHPIARELTTFMRRR